MEHHQSVWNEGPSPDVRTFACILKACGSARGAYKGKELHVEIARKGLFDSDSMLESALLDIYMANVVHLPKTQ